MGGGGGGRGISSDDIQRLSQIAKDKLTSGNTKPDDSPARHLFLSFAYENLGEVNLLRGQAKNENSALSFDDHSVKEAYNSENAEYIKSRIREKISRASVTMVYLSSDSAKSDWVNWEISESIKQGKGVIGVYKGTPPANLPSEFIKHKCKSVPWDHKEMMNAIENANYKRK